LVDHATLRILAADTVSLASDAKFAREMVAPASTNLTIDDERLVLITSYAILS